MSAVLGCEQSDNGTKLDAKVIENNVNPNKAILSESNLANSWFHAKKVKPLWAKEVTENGQIETLEGNEDFSIGDFICKGEAGDVWPQSAKSLIEKYQAEGEVNADGWRKYVPKKDAAGVMAIQIDHAFHVKTSWGDLQGKAGDYLLKNYSDRETEYPEDVWLVDQTIFNSTYELTK